MSLAEDWSSVEGAPNAAPAKSSLSGQWDQTEAKAYPAKTDPKYLDILNNDFNRGSAAIQKEGLSAVPKAIGEVVLGGATQGPLALLRHGVEEGAYLSGQSPEQAATTAQRTIPWQGYQPQTEAGQANMDMLGHAIEPVVNAGKWVASKLGFSPAAQNIAGDFAPIVAPKVASAVTDAVTSPIQSYQGAKTALANVAQGAQDTGRLLGDLSKQGSLKGAGARFNQLVDQGNAPATTATAQMLRGQESIPDNLQVPVDKAPEITRENASPELQKVLPKPEQSNPVAIQRHLEADSLPVKMQLSEGQATGDIHQLSNEFNGRARQPALADLFNRQNTDLINNVNAIRDRAAPEVNALDHVESGESLMNAYKAKDAAIKADINQKYSALREAAGGDFPVDAPALYKNIQSVLSDQLLTHDAPASQMAALKDLAEKGSMSYEKFLSLRKNLGNVARTAADGNTRTAAGLMIEQLESLPLSPEASALQPLANTARQAAKARFDQLGLDPAYKAAVNESVSPDKFIQKFVVNGAKGDVAQMRNFLQDNPTAQQNIAAGAINYLKSRAGIINDNGNFSQAGYNKAFNQLAPKLDYLVDPITAQQLDTLGKVARYTQEQPRGSYFNNSNTFVSAAKELGEGALNAKTGGLFGAAKNMVKTAKETNQAAESTKLGAGTKLKEIKPGSK